MTIEEVRRWLGWYMLVLVAVVATYILLAGDTWLLPLEEGDKISAFEIIVPFLLAQLTIIFSYYTGHDASFGRRRIQLPSFVVKGPLIVSSCILVLTGVMMAVGGHAGSRSTPTAATFKGVLTFVVAFLNASTVFVIGRVFGKPDKSDPASSGEPNTGQIRRR